MKKVERNSILLLHSSEKFRNLEVSYRSTAAPQHRSTAAPQHRSTAAPQHRVVSCYLLLVVLFLCPYRAFSTSDSQLAVVPGTATELQGLGVTGNLFIGSKSGFVHYGRVTHFDSASLYGSGQLLLPKSEDRSPVLKIIASSVTSCSGKDWIAVKRSVKIPRARRVPAQVRSLRKPFVFVTPFGLFSFSHSSKRPFKSPYPDSERPFFAMSGMVSGGTVKPHFLEKIERKIACLQLALYNEPKNQYPFSSKRVGTHATYFASGVTYRRPPPR